AAPQVAGIVALMISLYGNMKPKDMKKKVIEMGLRHKIQSLQDKQSPDQFTQPYGPNVRAHISLELYNAV
ncbi:hypothetical protein H0H93_005643, partial [Arthromyces matolae]